MKRELVLSIAALILCAACQERRPVVAQRRLPRPTPAPGFAASVDAATRAQLLAYAGSLTYDFTPPAADSQYLLVKSGANYVIGPWAVLAPEVGSAAVDFSGAAHGRVVAKLTLSAPHPDMQLPAGTSYIWVDSTGTAWRATLIPELASARIVHVPLKRTAYGTADTLFFAVARLMPPPHGAPAPASKGKDGFCVPCDNGFCCSAGGF